MTNPQGPPHQDPSIWARPGGEGPATEPAAHAESPTAQEAPVEQTHQIAPPPTLEFPADSPYEQPPTQDPTVAVKTKRRRRLLGDPLSIVLVVVIVVALVAAAVIGGELYARHRADNVVATA
ncbi:MAG TPA: DUF2993 domain-containing protein, partial [Mycobacterium sp.]